MRCGKRFGAVFGPPHFFWGSEMIMLKRLKIAALALLLAPLLAFGTSAPRDHGLVFDTNGAPSNTIGMIGDVAVDPNTGILYLKDATLGWVVTYTPAGAGSFTANSFVFAGTGGTLTSTTAPTNGQLLIGSTGAAPALATLTGTTNQVNVTNGAGSITFSLPSTLTLPGTLTIPGSTANAFMYSGAGGLVSTTAAPTNGQLLIGSTGNAPAVAALTGTSNQVSVTNGAGTITLGLPSTLAIPGTVTSVNGINTAGSIGIPFEVATANFLTQGANISSTSIYAVPTGQSGRYRVTMNTILVTPDGASSTLPNTNVSWTDADSSGTPNANIGATSTANTTSAASVGSLTVYAKAGTNINISTTGYASGTAGAMKYDARYQVEYLGN